MNEPLGIALELAARRKALAARMSELARRLAFPDLYKSRVVKRQIAELVGYAPRRISKGDEPHLTKYQKAEAARNDAALIVDVCAAIWEVPAEKIYDWPKRAIYARPRHAAMSLMRDLLKLSQPVVGVLLNRHHTTILAGQRTHWDTYASNADYARRYDNAEVQVRELLRNATAQTSVAASGEVDGVTRAPSHQPLANHQREAA